MIKKLFSCLAILLVAGATVVAADVDLEGVKCVVAPKAASEGKSAEYKEGKVYFCCGGCAGKFAKDTAKYAAKANHQLVATKQYEQKACPLSGQPTDASKSTKVAGKAVAFCCGNCLAKVEGAADEAAQIKLVFSDKAFGKGFAKKKSAE